MDKPAPVILHVPISTWARPWFLKFDVLGARCTFPTDTSHFSKEPCFPLVKKGI